MGVDIAAVGLVVTLLLLEAKLVAALLAVVDIASVVVALAAVSVTVTNDETELVWVTTTVVSVPVLVVAGNVGLAGSIMQRIKFETVYLVGSDQSTR